MTTTDQLPGSDHGRADGVNRRRFLQGAALTGTAALGSTIFGTGLGTAAFAQAETHDSPGWRTANDSRGLRWGLYANNPFGTKAEQRVILDAMRRALKEAPSGATAHLTAFTGIETRLKDDIIAAHQRGVRCRVSMDDEMSWSPKQHELARVLGTNPARRSCFVSLVGTGRAGRGQAHGKLFAIDHSGRRDKSFTMIGSSNMGTADVLQKWNTMYGMRRRPVYDWFARIHEQMLADVPLSDPYLMGGPFGPITSYVYPEVDRLWEHDDRYEFFSSIDPVGAKIYTTQHLWVMGGRGKQLAELMVQLVAAGAEVHVNGGERFRSPTVDFLRAGGVDVALCGRRGNGTLVWPHCKYWAVVSPQDEDCKVMEGSRNTGSIDRGEDFVVTAQGRELAQAYADHAALVRRVATGRPMR